jgi:predicted GH43/DUF377 family glycosyl hydrolase
MKREVPFYKMPLATTTSAGKIVLFSKIHGASASQSKKTITTSKIVFNTSASGVSFSGHDTEVHVFNGKHEIPADSIVSLKVFPSQSKLQNKKDLHVMTVEHHHPLGGVEVHTAFSHDMKKWLVKGGVVPVPFAKQAVFIPKIKGRLHNIVYYSDREVWAKIRRKVNVWDPGHIVINPRIDGFDSQPLEAMAFIPNVEGMFILYSSQSFSGNSVDMSVGAMLCSYTDPGRVLWRSEKPLWNGHFDNAEYLTPIGGEMTKKKYLLYWMDIKGELIVVSIDKNISAPFIQPEVIRAKGPLRRSIRNPIIAPREAYAWEADGTFNPAAFMDNDGYVHILYRAIGSDGISRIGYARSQDGIHFTRRSSGPVFQPLPGFGLPHASYVSGPAEYNPLFYTSGGSWGGSEDPRAVKIKNTIYMMYVAFEGWNSVRIALTSISEENLKNGKWFWKKPVLISPPGEMNKNWLLFPEKIKGKYAIVHSIVPHVLVEYVDNLEDFDGKHFIHSPRPQGPQPGRNGYWDSFIRGAGPPPLKTESGWLLLYHALDKNDSGRYKLGALILDKNNPTKVLYRANNPVLSPDMPYENDGKPGVVYASGAVIKDDKLFIYYGGGDRVVCVAVSPLEDFLKYVKEGKAPQLNFLRIVI